MADEADVEGREAQVAIVQRTIVGRVAWSGGGAYSDRTRERQRDLRGDVKLYLRLQRGVRRLAWSHVELRRDAHFDVRLDQSPIALEVQINQRDGCRFRQLVIRVRRHLQTDIRLVDQVDFSIVRAELEGIQVSIDESDSVGCWICPLRSVRRDPGRNVGSKVSIVVILSFSFGSAASGAAIYRDGIRRSQRASLPVIF